MREETLKFRIEVPHENNDADVKSFYNVATKDGDNVVFEYYLNITYFGDVVERLQTLRRILAKNKILELDTEELKHGECLFQEVLKEIHAIQDQLK